MHTVTCAVPALTHTRAAESAQAKHVIHRVAARRFPDDPARGPKRAGRKGLPARRFVGQLQSFAGRGKNHRMIADNVASPDGVHTYLVVRSLADRAVSSMRNVVDIVELAHIS